MPEFDQPLFYIGDTKVSLETGFPDRPAASKFIDVLAQLCDDGNGGVGSVA